MPVFNEATLIPVSLLITLGGSFVGFVAWLTKLHWDVGSLKKDSSSLRKKVDDELQQNKTDSERLVRLETQVSVMLDQIKEIKQYMKELLEKR